MIDVGMIAPTTSARIDSRNDSPRNGVAREARQAGR